MTSEELNYARKILLAIGSDEPQDLGNSISLSALYLPDNDKYNVTLHSKGYNHQLEESRSLKKLAQEVVDSVGYIKTRNRFK